jgi:alkaline phosphatase
MFITNQNITKSIVQIVEREKSLIVDIKNINERYETALNLKNMQELKAIEEEGAEIEKRYKQHVGEKVMVMAFALGMNRNFVKN